jgi:hypothetical protein
LRPVHPNAELAEASQNSPDESSGGALLSPPDHRERFAKTLLQPQDFRQKVRCRKGLLEYPLVHDAGLGHSEIHEPPPQGFRIGFSLRKQRTGFIGQIDGFG